jgi:hypothetical protein
MGERWIRYFYETKFTLRLASQDMSIQKREIGQDLLGSSYSKWTPAGYHKRIFLGYWRAQAALTTSNRLLIFRISFSLIGLDSYCDRQQHQNQEEWNELTVVVKTQ